MDLKEEIKEIGLENIDHILITQKYLDENDKEYTLKDTRNNYDLVKDLELGFLDSVPSVNVYLDNSIDNYKIIKRSETNYYGRISVN